MNRTRIALLIALLSTAHVTTSAAPLPAGVKGALDNERIGLLDANTFALNDGTCKDCQTLKQALWYFDKDVVALPAAGQQSSGFATTGDRITDVQQWATSGDAAKLAHPSLVWIGSPLVLENGQVQPDGVHVRTADGTELGLKLVPKLATNLSYANDDTTRFFAQRPVRMRGSIDAQSGAFVARTIWPLDFNIDSASLKPAGPVNAGDLVKFVQAPAGQKNTQQSGIESQLLWERHPGQARQWEGKPVLGIMLNGAQGDDDESLGGHFAIATGRYGSHGEWHDWTVNNFYNLDSVSEKGIIAGSVPMDNYLMDLNSGQQYYRPSYMLVAVLRDGRTAVAYQGAVQRTFNHFYRHDFTYQHADANCAGISVDVFNALGWHVPERGAGAPVKAVGAYFYLAAKDRSLASGRKIYDYLTEEQTRLYPAVAFDAAGQDLLRLVGALPADKRALTPYEQQLQSDIEAIMVVRIPQVPSSRAMGSAPVFSFEEYMSRVPKDQADWKVVPVGPRPFPAELRDGAALKDPGSPGVPLPVVGITAGVAGGIAALAQRRRKKRAGGVTANAPAQG